MCRTPALRQWKRKGFTLLELILVIAIISVMSAFAVPAFSSLYGDICLKRAVLDMKTLFKDAKLLSIQGKSCAILFDPAKGRATLYSGRGPDDKWDTGDETLVSELDLSEMGGGLSFGYGTRGPVRNPRELAKTDDGVAFQYNRFVSDEGVVGIAGSVYIQSASSGGAAALVFNRADFSCSIHRWDGKDWIKM